MIKKIRMTQKELVNKQKELEKSEKELISLQKRSAVSSTFGTDIEAGGINTELLQCYQEYAPIYQRISELKDEIDHAEIVEIKDDGKVGYGAVVVVKFIYDVDDVEETKLLITSSSVSNYEKYTVCTPSSPLFAFIEGKEKKYKDPIAQGGSNVSGGQKQRLSIARAIAKDPEIFIFDDSFSALDFKTDSKLREALSEKTQNKTVIIVAQRISTILNADKIIVLEEGKIVGQGTHEELMQNNETYKQIALSQLSQDELNGKGGK